MKADHVTIIGRGAWGCAMGHVLQENGLNVAWMVREDPTWAPAGPGTCVFLAFPTQSIRGRLQSLPNPGVPVISLAKGIEVDTFKRVSEIVEEVWPGVDVASLSGPTFAAEVEKLAPTAAVVASRSESLTHSVQAMVHQKWFRLYRSTDLRGVEFGGALKNVYALAGGMCEGLQVGENAMAALMTRALTEMTRIATSLGARPETLAGLSGMGDLMLTAYSGKSRNHQAGVALGCGKAYGDLHHIIPGTIEGVETTRAVARMVADQNIKAPIVNEIYQVLFEGKRPDQAMEDLMLRQVSEE